MSIVGAYVCVCASSMLETRLLDLPAPGQLSRLSLLFLSKTLVLVCLFRFGSGGNSLQKIAKFNSELMKMLMYKGHNASSMEAR